MGNRKPITENRNQFLNEGTGHLIRTKNKIGVSSLQFPTTENEEYYDFLSKKTKLYTLYPKTSIGVSEIKNIDITFAHCLSDLLKREYENNDINYAVLKMISVLIPNEDAPNNADLNKMMSASENVEMVYQKALDLQNINKDIDTQ